MEIHIGEVYWSDDEPEVYGERFTFDGLKSIGPDEIVLVEDDAEVEPYGAVAARLESLDDVCAKFYRGTSKLIVIGRDDMIEPCDEEHGDFAMVWRIRNADAPEDAPEIKEGGSMEDHAGEEIMLTEKQQAEALHRRIKRFGTMIMQSFYELCIALKEMRDKGLYKALGYREFDLYCKSEFCTSDRQIYKYIAIAENLPEDLVNSNSLIGVSKLYLLTTADEETRAEIVQNTNLTETTVRELKAQIAALQTQNAATEKARQDAEERAQKWYDEAQDAKEEAKEAEEAKERNRLTLVGLMEKKQEQVRRLEAQIKELESKPQDVAVVDRTEEIDRLNAEIAVLREKLAEKPDMQLPMNVEPIYQQDTKAVFKPYYTAAVDAINRLADFIGQHRTDSNYNFFIEKMQSAFAFANEKITMAKGE